MIFGKEFWNKSSVRNNLFISLKNDQLNVEKVKILEEYSGVEGTA